MPIKDKFTTEAFPKLLDLNQIFEQLYSFIVKPALSGQLVK